MAYDHNTHQGGYYDPLVDRDCVVLDGKCSCKKVEGKTVPPDCKYLKYAESVPKVRGKS